MQRKRYLFLGLYLGVCVLIGQPQPPVVTAVFMTIRQDCLTEPASTPVENALNDLSLNKSKVDRWAFQVREDRLRISLDGESIVDFVFRDPDILRPYFANAKLADGRMLTRNHPPIADLDAVDHDRMHPGIWLGFGDINGEDFWRNKAGMEHTGFIEQPRVDATGLRFATGCQLRATNGTLLGTVKHQIGLAQRPTGWLLVWRAVFLADHGPLTFGDQEEMGFAARVATPLTEQSGGSIRNARGQVTAAGTWGQPAAWCDYSGGESTAGGILLLSGKDNFRESWWHNRDYGVMVANPFGRAAMQQGPPSEVTIVAGESLPLTFGALLHDQTEVDFEAERAAFEAAVSWLKAN